MMDEDVETDLDEAYTVAMGKRTFSSPHIGYRVNFAESILFPGHDLASTSNQRALEQAALARSNRRMRDMLYHPSLFHRMESYSNRRSYAQAPETTLSSMAVYMAFSFFSAVIFTCSAILLGLFTRKFPPTCIFALLPDEE